MLILIRKLFVVSRWRPKILWKARPFREEQRLRLARLSKQLGEFPAVGSVGGMMETEVVHIQRERPVLILPDHLPYFVYIARLAIRGHAHHFVLTFIHLKTEESGECAIQQTDRVWEIDLLLQFDFSSASHAISCGDPLPYTVDR